METHRKTLPFLLQSSNNVISIGPFEFTDDRSSISYNETGNGLSLDDYYFNCVYKYIYCIAPSKSLYNNST